MDAAGGGPDERRAPIVPGRRRPAGRRRRRGDRRGVPAAGLPGGGVRGGRLPRSPPPAAGRPRPRTRSIVGTQGTAGRPARAAPPAHLLRSRVQGAAGAGPGAAAVRGRAAGRCWTWSTWWTTAGRRVAAFGYWAGYAGRGAGRPAAPRPAGGARCAPTTEAELDAALRGGRRSRARAGGRRPRAARGRGARAALGGGRGRPHRLGPRRDPGAGPRRAARPTTCWSTRSSTTARCPPFLTARRTWTGPTAGCGPSRDVTGDVRLGPQPAAGLRHGPPTGPSPYAGCAEPTRCSTCIAIDNLPSLLPARVQRRVLGRPAAAPAGLRRRRARCGPLALDALPEAAATGRTPSARE